MKATLLQTNKLFTVEDKDGIGYDVDVMIDHISPQFSEVFVFDEEGVEVDDEIVLETVKWLINEGEVTDLVLNAKQFKN
jgi:hypothetical protein